MFYGWSDVIDRFTFCCPGGSNPWHVMHHYICSHWGKWCAVLVKLAIKVRVG